MFTLFISIFITSDFNGTSLFDAEYLRKDTRYTHGYYIPVVESDMWPIELCHHQ